MKIRTDFITNSSSSSFILAFNSKSDGLEKISDMTKRYGSDYIQWVLDDFNNAEPISRDELYDKIYDYLDTDARWEMYHLQDAWLEQHPDAKWTDYYDSEEFKQGLKAVIEREYQKILNSIGNCSYIVDLEYEDHTEIGSELEHNILPDCDFTVRRFSHH